MMGIALTMARLGLGTTAPNPSVGAVLVDPTSSEVIARGTTASGGRPHGERVALARAGDRARGATLYVTLEPCSHHGQTSPCADAIIEAGIARVVCGIEDPDPRVAGRGLERLRAAGICVVRSVRAAQAYAITRGHITRISQRRPFVHLKLALTHEGLVPRGSAGRANFVTGPDARALGHLMRAQTDAILVGSSTVRADDPELTCRLPGLAQRSPRRVVLASEGLDLAGTKLAATAMGSARVPLCVVTGPDAPAIRVAAMRACGADVRAAALVGGALWLPSVLETLAAEGVTRLLVEGGPRIWSAFGRAGLVDEVTLFVAGETDDPLAMAAHYLGPLPLTVLDQRRIGPDTFWRMGIDPRPGSKPRDPRLSLAYPVDAALPGLGDSGEKP